MEHVQELYFVPLRKTQSIAMPKQTISIKSINVSSAKDSVKRPLQTATISALGLQGDAHAGTWHRQVSIANIHRLKDIKGKPILPGELGENLTIEGVDFNQVSIFDRFISDDVVLEVTEIGSERPGSEEEDEEGLIYCRVLRPGKIQQGQTLIHQPKIFRIQIVRLSDEALVGEDSDESGQQIIHLCEFYFANRFNHFQVRRTIIPDNASDLKRIIETVVEDDVDILITSGGIGIGKKAITPGVIKPQFTWEIPGLMEKVRNKCGQKIPRAYLYNSLAGVINETLVFALPANKDAVKDYMEEILKVIDDLIYMLHGIDNYELNDCSYNEQH